VQTPRNQSTQLHSVDAIFIKHVHVLLVSFREFGKWVFTGEIIGRFFSISKYSGSLEKLSKGATDGPIADHTSQSHSGPFTPIDTADNIALGRGLRTR